MDDACSALEIECKRVCNDLEFVSHRLETEFRSRSDIPDVVSLIRRIHALESNLLETKKRSEEFLQQRRRVASRATSLLLSNHSQLSRLIEDSGYRAQSDLRTGTIDQGQIRRLGSESDDVTASDSNRTDRTYADFNDEDFLDAKSNLLNVLHQCSFVDKNENKNDIENIRNNNSNINQSDNMMAHSDDKDKINNNIIYNNTKNDKIEKSIIETKKIKNGSVSTDLGKSFDISLEAFENVPVSIRGRCRHIDVQQVLTRLQTHYTTYINSHSAKRVTAVFLSVLQPLSISELTLSGLKVTGKTGDCVLGTLRSLGYIKVGKTGKTGILLSDVMIAKFLR